MGSSTTHGIWTFTRRVLLVVGASVGIIVLAAIGVWLGVLLGLWTYIEVNG